MDIFDRFDELTTPLLSDYANVHSKIPVLISDIADIQSEVSEYLAALAKQFDSDEFKNSCCLPSAKMAIISEKVVDFDRRINALVVNCRGGSECLRTWRNSNPGQLELVSLDSRLATEDRYICERFRFAMSTRDSTWNYFAALPSLSLFQALESYRDLNLTFLRKDPGGRIDLSVGISVLLETQPGALIDEVTFNFGSALLRAANVATAFRAEEDVSYPTSADTQLESILQFKDALENLDAQIHLVSAVLSTAEVAVANCISNIEASGSLFTKRLIEIGGAEPTLSS